MDDKKPKLFVFKWKNRYGTEISVHDMSTTHLYLVLRRLWNHTMPMELHLRPFRRYRFHSFYTMEYRFTAIRHIGRELMKRKDLPEIFREEAHHMTKDIKEKECQIH